MLIAIPIFIHDSLCIYSFNDSNDRVNWLFTLDCGGFYVGKQIAQKVKIARNKDLHYNAFGKLQDGWHEGTERLVFVCRVLKKLFLPHTR